MLISPSGLTTLRKKDVRALYTADAEEPRIYLTLEKNVNVHVLSEVTETKNIENKTIAIKLEKKNCTDNVFVDIVVYLNKTKNNMESIARNNKQDRNDLMTI